MGKSLSCVFLAVALAVLGLSAHEEENVYVARVVDSATGEPVPFASVRFPYGSTIANKDGRFVLQGSAGDSLLITSVGYSGVCVIAGDMGTEVKLQPAEVVLGGVTVVPWSTIMDRIVETASSAANRCSKETSVFLYRQTTEVNGTVTSLVEAAVGARSAFSLREVSLVSGRYSERATGGLMPHIANLFPLSEIGILDGFGDNPLDVSMPLSRNYLKHYSISHETIGDSVHTVYAIHFTPLRRPRNSALFSGTVYVDASTLLPLKADGKVFNSGIMIGSNVGAYRVWVPLEVSYTITYDITGGYSDVQSVYVSARYELGHDSVRFSSLMYNVGGDGVQGGSPLQASVDIRRQIDRLGYDADFWKGKEIVKRTAAEAELALMLDGNDVHQAVPVAAGNSAALDSLRRFVGGIESFNRLFPQEKAYLHLDNTGYFRGETMWFSAYVVRTDLGSLTDLSRVLYVELLDPTGEVVATRKVRLENGRGSGSFKLDKLLTSGFYEVRAYTRYMLNWDSAWAFSRVLPVFNAPGRAGDYSRAEIAAPVWRKRLPSSREADTLIAKAVNVSFHPEGGRLVQGLPSRVAFSVTDGDGRPLDCTGRLTLADGTAVEVSTQREGRGVFAYTPSGIPATLTLADVIGRRRTFTLPGADASGCVMTVDAVSGDHVEVEVRRTADFREPLALVLLSGGNVDATDIIGAGEQTARRRFARSDMAPGVSQLSLIGQDGRIVAERMVFVYPHGGIDTIHVTATGSLSPCGKFRLEARTRPGAEFSLSVRDAATDVNGTCGDAATWLLLSSDLRGYVHDPGYYLESDDAAHRRAADLLMLVQGWRRYDVAVMDGSRSFVRRHPLEDGLYLYGRLRPARKRHSVCGVGLRATLYNRAGESMGGEAVTDSLGGYAFRLPDCDGEWTLLLNAAKGGEAANCRVGIDRNFSPAARPLSPLETARSEVYAPLLPLSAAPGFDTLAARLPMAERVHVLKEVKVKGRRLFENARAAWETEQRGAFRSYVRYDCDKAADEIYDRGGEMPGILEWLAMKNEWFSGSTTDMDELYIYPTPLNPDGSEIDTDKINKINISLLEDAKKTTPSADQEKGDYTADKIGHVINLQGLGLAYKKRPIVWVLNNNYYCLSMAPISVSTKDILHIYSYSIERMPLYLDECKSVYISEDDDIWRHYVDVKGLDRYSPVTVFVYTHHALPASHKGLRRTHFEGYSKVETFQMPDYSLMPPEADHRRTLYWNPAVKADGAGNATIDIYNNSTCKRLAVSAEGITADGQAVVYKP